MKTSRFAQYAAEGSKRMFLGDLLKYVKGTWELGRDRVSVPSSKSFVAVMGTVTIGHIKWVGGKPVDHRMGLLADGFHAVHRNDLDDLDSKNWEVNDDNERVDPWQKTALLVLASPAAPHDLFTFSTSTVGGENAIVDLCGAHSATTEDLGQYPVVRLGTDSYEHRIKSRGSVNVPVFKIVDCVDAGPFNALVAGARGGAVFIPTSPPALGTSRMGAMVIEGPPKPPSSDDDDGPPSPHPDDPGPSLDSDLPF